MNIYVDTSLFIHLYLYISIYTSNIYMNIFFYIVYMKTFFLRTARLRESLPAKCFPLNYDLECSKRRVIRHLSCLGLF